MIRLIGKEKIVANLISLSYPFNTTKDHSFAGLKKAYKGFLQHIQPDIPKGSKDAVEFVKDPHLTNKLMAIFDEKSRLDDFDEVFSQAAPQGVNLEELENHYLSLKDYDETLFNVFSLVVNLIFTSPSGLAGGGSSSGAVGCIWVNPRPNWTKQDFLEFFIHELTHNLVFLDEYRFHHYTDYSQILSESNFTISAILSKKRPLDKVFHSIIVSTEILLSRNDLGHPSAPKLHPKSATLLEKTMRSIESLENFAECYSLLTARGKELITLCKERLKNMPLGSEIAGSINCDGALQ